MQIKTAMRVKGGFKLWTWITERFRVCVIAKIGRPVRAFG